MYDLFSKHRFQQLRKYCLEEDARAAFFFPRRQNLEMHQSLVSICDSSNCQRCLVNFNDCHNCKGYRQLQHKSITIVLHKCESVCVCACTPLTVKSGKSRSKFSNIQQQQKPPIKEDEQGQHLFSFSKINSPGLFCSFLLLYHP